GGGGLGGALRAFLLGLGFLLAGLEHRTMQRAFRRRSGVRRGLGIGLGRLGLHLDQRRSLGFRRRLLALLAHDALLLRRLGLDRCGRLSGGRGRALFLLDRRGALGARLGIGGLARGELGLALRLDLALARFQLVDD